MLPSWCRETVTVLRAAYVVDRYGNATTERDWANATARSLSGCSVQPVAGNEVLVDRDAIINRWIIYAPKGSDVLSTDRVVHKGITYEVDGDVRVWTGATGNHDSVQAILQRVEG